MIFLIIIGIIVFTYLVMGVVGWLLFCYNECKHFVSMARKDKRNVYITTFPIVFLWGVIVTQIIIEIIKNR